jgi:hypothetical protein
VLSARELALRVKRSALPSRHKNIVLNICNTNGSLQEFATDFRNELWQLNYTAALQVSYFGGAVSLPVVLPAGKLGQTVVFLSSQSLFIATPSGLAYTNTLYDADLFRYVV